MNQAALSPGEVFKDRYVIDRELGRGAIGVVYRVFERGKQKPLALKMLLPDRMTDKEHRRRFKREAEIAYLLKGDHNVHIYDFGKTPDGNLFLIMEYLEGDLLDKLIARYGKVSPLRTALISRQICIALSEAHGLGIIHRDLKPSNIFIARDEDGNDFVKVFDFGIAKIAESGDDNRVKEVAKLTAAGMVLGSPLYMSPEQFQADSVLTVASDMYSLGVVMYEMLTGHVPFSGDQAVEVMLKHLKEPVPQLPPDIEANPIADVVYQALEKKPEDRFESVDDFMHAIDTALRSKRRKPAAAPATKSKKKSKRVGADSSDRKLKLLVALLLGLSALILVAAVLVWLLS